MRRLFNLFFVITLFAAVAYGQAPDISSQVDVSIGQTRTTLDRGTGKLISTVNTLSANHSGSSFQPSLHFVVGISSTITANVDMPDALGGDGVGPYGTYYFDVESKFPAARFSSGRLMAQKLRFERHKYIRFMYDTTPRGTMAAVQPPNLNLTPLAYSINEGDTLTFNMTASDPDGDIVTLSSTPALQGAQFFPTNGVAAAATYVFSSSTSQQGLFTIVFTARDSLGLSTSAVVRITVNPVNQAPTISAPATAEVNEGQLITIPVTGSDPDGDPIIITAAPLPDNAIFIQAAGGITFAPDYTQAGLYSITCNSFDGAAYSTSTVIDVTVNDITAGGETSELVLVVHPIESPTLLERQRVTGTVNADTNLPPGQTISASLITGLAPVNAWQGETRDITITGKNSAPFATHFSKGLSAASFGPGVTVNSLTINSAWSAVANITIDTDAAIGTRSVQVQTGDETAIAVPAFTIQEGLTSITGRIIDPDTGLPLAGAIVSIEGTFATAATLGDGTFTLTGVPPGELLLVVNAPDHAILRIPVIVGESATVELGDLGTTSIVFNPATAAGVSLFSIMNRGLGNLQPGRITLDEGMQLVRDTMLLVGGHEAGVLDEFGNQLNPAVDGDGSLSLMHRGVELYGGRLALGDSVTLVDLLADLSFAFDYEGGTRPSLDDWMTALQSAVNIAWSDPTDPHSAVLVSVFNHGRSVTPDPPTLAPDMRLTRMQAFLVLSGMLSAMYNHDGDWYTIVLPEPTRLESMGLTINELLSAFTGPMAYAQLSGGSTGIFTKTWDDVMTDLGTYPTSAVYSATGGTNVYTMPAVEDVLSTYYRTGDTGTLAEVRSVLESNFTGAAASELDEIFDRNPYGVSQALNTLVLLATNSLSVRTSLQSIAGVSPGSSLNMTIGTTRGPAVLYPLFGLTPPGTELAPNIIVKSTAPDAPYIYSAREKTAALGSYVIPAVHISFYPSGDDYWPNPHPANAKFYYRLWRLDTSLTSPTNPSVFRMVAGGAPTYTTKTSFRAPHRDPDNEHRLRFTVPLPPPGMNHYRIDCIRSTPDVINHITTNQLNQLDAWLTGFIDDPIAASLDQVTALGQRPMQPGATLLKNNDVKVSAMGNVGSVYVAGGGSGLSALGRVNLTGDYDEQTNLYVGLPDYRSNTNTDSRGSGAVAHYNPETGAFTNLFGPGFMQPGQVGLAKEEDLNTFFLENGASEFSYGGRLFRYDLNGPVGNYTNRRFVGTVNYYSSLLQRGEPAMIQATLMGRPVKTNYGNALYLADCADHQIKYHEVYYPEYVTSADPTVEIAAHNVAHRWAWNTTNFTGSDYERLFFQAGTDLAFDRNKKHLFITQSTHVLSTTGGADTAVSITTNGVLFTAASGCAVCESREGQFLMVADAGSDRILRVPLDALPINVPTTAAEQQALIDQFTIVTNVNNPGDIVIMDNGRAMVWADQDGLQTYRFGLHGTLTNEFGAPLARVELILSTAAGETTTSTDQDGNYYFPGQENVLSGTLTVNDPAYSLAEEINIDYQCGYGLGTNDPSLFTPCISIGSPADGATRAGTLVHVTGLIAPEEIDFASADGELEVSNGLGARKYGIHFAADNTFAVSNVSLTIGGNYIKARVSPFGDYGPAESPTVRVSVSPTQPNWQAVSGFARHDDGRLASGAKVIIYVDGDPWGDIYADACGLYTAKGVPLGTITVEVVQ